MKDELFQELLESVRQGGAMLRGEAAPARTFRYDADDVLAIRTGMGLSQARFAGLMGISVGTLRNWEQGRRLPEGPARVLLDIAHRHPDVVLGVVRERPAPYGRPRPAEDGDESDEGQR